MHSGGPVINREAAMQPLNDTSITSEVNQTMGLLGNLSELIANLEDKLDTILTPKQPGPAFADGKTDIDTKMSKLQLQILDSNVALSNLGLRLNEIIYRINL